MAADEWCEACGNGTGNGTEEGAGRSFVVNEPDVRSSPLLSFCLLSLFLFIGAG
eukprot:gene37668-29029_t